MWSPFKRPNKDAPSMSSLSHPQSEDHNFHVDWNALHQELSNTHALISSALHSSSSHDHLHLLHNLHHSIVHAVYFLLHGFPLHDTQNSSNQQFTPEHRASPLSVWPSAHHARIAIVEQLLQIIATPRSSRPQALPVVVLITDSFPLPNEHPDPRYTADSLDPFFSSWNLLCKQTTQLFTIVPQSAQKLCSTVEALLEPSSHDRSVCPALVVLYLSCDSFITSNIPALRAVCDANRAHLCMDGPGLALLAQPNTPDDPQYCLHLADLLIVDPSAWFGFDDCAVVTLHSSHPSVSDRSYGCRRRSTAEVMPFPLITPPDPLPSDFPAALVPYVKLWTVLSRIGTHTMRHIVDRATTLAESFVHLLHSSRNLQTSYEGVACVVRISYTLPRDDRRMTPHRARSLVSAVNEAVYAATEERAAILNILRGDGEHGAFIHFSPARLLAWGATAMPTTDDIHAFTMQLQDAADRFEACRVGSPAFESRVSKCANLQLVDVQERSEDLALSYGCFRIVPSDFRQSWRSLPQNVQVVTSLTSALAAELSNSPQLALTTARIESELIKNNLHREGNHALNGYNESDSKQASSGELVLPFAFFLHSEMPSSIPDFLSVEPRAACPPVEAVRQAHLAAELVIHAVQATITAWSENEHFPIDLPNSRSSNAGDMLHVRQAQQCVHYGGAVPSHGTPVTADRTSKPTVVQLPSYENNANTHTDDRESSDIDDFYSATSGEIETVSPPPREAILDGQNSPRTFGDRLRSMFGSNTSEKHHHNNEPAEGSFILENIIVGDYGPMESDADPLEFVSGGSVPDIASIRNSEQNIVMKRRESCSRVSYSDHQTEDMGVSEGFGERTDPFPLTKWFGLWRRGIRYGERNHNVAESVENESSCEQIGDEGNRCASETGDGQERENQASSYSSDANSNTNSAGCGGPKSQHSSNDDRDGQDGSSTPSDKSSENTLSERSEEGDTTSNSQFTKPLSHRGHNGVEEHGFSTSSVVQGDCGNNDNDSQHHRPVMFDSPSRDSQRTASELEPSQDQAIQSTFPRILQWFQRSNISPSTTRKVKEPKTSRSKREHTMDTLAPSSSHSERGQLKSGSSSKESTIPPGPLLNSNNQKDSTENRRKQENDFSTVQSHPKSSPRDTDALQDGRKSTSEERSDSSEVSTSGEVKQQNDQVWGPRRVISWFQSKTSDAENVVKPPRSGEKDREAPSRVEHGSNILDDESSSRNSDIGEDTVNSESSSSTNHSSETSEERNTSDFQTSDCESDISGYEWNDPYNVGHSGNRKQSQNLRTAKSDNKNETISTLCESGDTDHGSITGGSFTTSQNQSLHEESEASENKDTVASSDVRSPSEYDNEADSEENASMRGESQNEDFSFNTESECEGGRDSGEDSEAVQEQEEGNESEGSIWTRSGTTSSDISEMRRKPECRTEQNARRNTDPSGNSEVSSVQDEHIGGNSNWSDHTEGSSYFSSGNEWTHESGNENSEIEHSDQHSMYETSGGDSSRSREEAGKHNREANKSKTPRARLKRRDEQANGSKGEKVERQQNPTVLQRYLSWMVPSSSLWNKSSKRTTSTSSVDRSGVNKQARQRRKVH